MNPGRIFIYEDNPSGHRLAYVRLLANHALSIDLSLTLLLTEATYRSSHFVEHLQAFTNSVKLIHPIRNTAGILDIESKLRVTSDDIIVFPDADHLAMRLAISGHRGKAHLVLLLMRPPNPQAPHPHHPQQLLKRFLVALARQRVGRVHIFSLSSPKATLAAHEVSDPASLAVHPGERPSARESLGLSSKAYWVAIAGSISARKNVPLVCQALEQLLSDGQRRVGLLLAGPIQEAHLGEVMQSVDVLHRKGVPVVVLNRTLPTQSLDKIILAADCITIAHSNQGSSGILLKALLAGTPVVASGAASVVKTLQQFRSGEWCELNSASISQAIARALASPRPKPCSLPSESEFSARLLLHEGPSAT